MPKLEFAAKPFYESVGREIYDTRVTSLLSELALLPAPVEPLHWHDRYNIPRVHDIEGVFSVGSDGEMASGGIQLLDITSKEGNKLTVLRSYQFNHDSQLPIFNHSWYAEFDNPESAREFWEAWKPKSFDIQGFIDSIRDYAKAHPGVLSNDNTRLYGLGLLLPWYEKREGDHDLLDKFATVGGNVVALPDKYQPAEGLVVGQVYKVPQTGFWTYKVHEWIAKTCLASLVLPGEPAGYFRSVPMPAKTIVQWSDGTLESFDQNERAPQPTPLRPKEIKSELATV